ncbi:MAG: xylose isomerase [Planctomycetaceae bacterium]|nr:xylose isomerase [Planctomycetaceae bacterium]
MNNCVSRRSFLAATATAATLSVAPAKIARAGQFTGKIKKAVKYGMVQDDMPIEDKLRMVKDLGYDGIEPQASHGKRHLDVTAAEFARAAEKVDLPIHGVINSDDPDLRAAIDQAKMYGASSVLTTLPGMPKQGSYLENYRETQQILKDVAPYAEKHEIHVLIENVWNSFLIEPLTMARYVDEIDSPFVQVYFDVGNVVRWGWPQHWIEVLGKRIVKLDIKEFDLKVAYQKGMLKAFANPLGQGSVEWDKVRIELAKINFTGWATAEVQGGDKTRLAQIAQRMDRVLDL